MAINLGQVTFNIVDINPDNVATIFQTFLDRGSKVTGVPLDELDVGLSELPADGEPITLVSLLEKGMPIFDAVTWLGAGQPASHPLQVNPVKTADRIPSMSQISDALIYTFFLLLTQARYPQDGGGNAAPRIPHFLQQVLALREPQSHYLRIICSFSPEKFDPKWIRTVQFANFGQEIMSRFGLGVAGYRLFSPFKLYQPRTGLTPALTNACAFARAVAVAPPSWNIHPITRNPAVLNARGNLNKNLANLILEVFTTEQITEMVTSRVLFAVPVRDPTHRNYLTWGAADDITGDAPIF